MNNYLDTVENLVALAMRAGATAADAVLFASTDLAVSVRMSKTEQLERAESLSTGLRVWVGNAQALVSTSDITPDSLHTLTERAVAMAKTASPDPFSTLAPPELLATTFPKLDLWDKNEPTPEALRMACLEAEDAARSVQGITNSEGSDAHFSTTHIALATSHGFAQTYPISNTSLSVSVLAGSGTSMERDYDHSSARFLADLASPAAIGKEAARRTVARLNPKKIETAKLPVLFDPRVGHGLLSAFTSSINGVAIARGTSFLKHALSTQIFTDAIQIIDDPHIRRGLASRPFDAEGVTNSVRNLVENGILKHWLLDTRSAAQLGLKTNGNASRSVASAPSPSTTNCYIAAGEKTPSELIQDITRGVYITDTFGMGVNIVTGDYSQGASGFLIEQGEITHAISEFTIAGHLTDMFSNMEAASDLEFRFGTNTPTLRIEHMTIAGS